MVVTLKFVKIIFSIVQSLMRHVSFAMILASELGVPNREWNLINPLARVLCLSKIKRGLPSRCDCCRRGAGAP